MPPAFVRQASGYLRRIGLDGMSQFVKKEDFDLLIEEIRHLNAEKKALYTIIEVVQKQRDEARDLGRAIARASGYYRTTLAVS